MSVHTSGSACTVTEVRNPHAPQLANGLPPPHTRRIRHSIRRLPHADLAHDRARRDIDHGHRALRTQGVGDSARGLRRKVGDSALIRQCVHCDREARCVPIAEEPAMSALSPSLYTFAWRHEECHLRLNVNAFLTVPDPRIVLETIVRPDTASFHRAANTSDNGFAYANVTIGAANTIDNPPNPPTFTFWSRDATNSAWFRRTYPAQGILAPGC
jgi:hypothetical protein